MARNQEAVTCPPNVWTELTNGAATDITFQVVRGSVKLRCTTGATPASLTDPGYIYHARAADAQQESGELRVAIADLAAVAGANRVFAMSTSGRKALVVVDHV